MDEFVWPRLDGDWWVEMMLVGGVVWLVLPQLNAPVPAVLSITHRHPLLEHRCHVVLLQRQGTAGLQLIRLDTHGHITLDGI